jgi:MFS family permease
MSSVFKQLLKCLWRFKLILSFFSQPTISNKPEIKLWGFLTPKVLIGSFLNFFDHIETAIYLALGPVLILSGDCQNKSLWILGLLSGGMAKLLFSFIWSGLFRLFGLKLILSFSWCALALSCLAFGCYGLSLTQASTVALVAVMVFRFFQSLCSSAQTHACRVWIFSNIENESTDAVKTSAFFGLSTSLGIMCGLAIMLVGSFFRPIIEFWPWVYFTLSLIALFLAHLVWLFVNQDPIEIPHHDWPKLKEIFTCAIMSSFGYSTYYWACLFLAAPLTQLSEGKNKLIAQTEALAFDSLLMLPLGALCASLGTKYTLRLGTLGCLTSLCLTSLGVLHLSALRWFILILGVLSTCAHSAWIKKRLRLSTFFPGSLIGNAFGALIGSSAFYWAQKQGHESLFLASLPFMILSSILFYMNEKKEAT